MSTDKLIEALGKRIERRTLLGRLGVGAVGVVLGLLGQSQPAAATVPSFCCNLCFSSSSSCSSGCTTCAWCWTCPHTDGFYYQCCECHCSNDGCPGGCGNVCCSWSRRIGNAPSPA